GNLTNDGRWSYVWDGENRLIQMSVNTNVGPQYQLNFAYDYQGRRIQKAVAIGGAGAYTNDFLYDGWNLIATLNSQSSLLASYRWGLDLSGSMQGVGGVGGLLEEIDYGTATNFVAFDGNGNVAALVNAADGTLTANYEYGSFGEPIRMTGPQAKANPLRFSTKYDDDESDLLYYGYRYYDPSTGRWLNRDLVGAGEVNLYEFILNDPVRYIDVFGLHTVDITAKSWIAKPIRAGYVPGGFQPMLYAAVAEVSTLTRDRVVDDAIDGKYRFLSQKVISVECNGSSIASYHFSSLYTDVGLEGGFMIPPAPIVVYDNGTSSGSALYFDWMVKARPKPLAEYFVFDPVKPRHGHVYIWHRVFGSVKCSCGSPSVDLDLDQSQFPSAAVYYRIDGVLSLPPPATHRQGPMSELWDPSPFDPTLVR
ncbi:MAG TPA: RHS repeat-associated core domain-containing protein, partial [Verrucomicrobiae bacterium]|nr:RHS repeat-associated core domain-containing protein [Verrucomicrobiae bacterium]